MQNEKIHKRGRYTAEFKEKVALEALTGGKTHAQIASEYGISPDLVKDWKKQAKDMLCLVNVSVEEDVRAKWRKRMSA